MPKQKKESVAPENKEYSLGCVSRADVRDALGDDVADQMTDDLMKKLAGALGDHARDDRWFYAYVLHHSPERLTA